MLRDFYSLLSKRMEISSLFYELLRENSAATQHHTLIIPYLKFRFLPSGKHTTFPLKKVAR